MRRTHDSKHYGIMSTQCTFHIISFHRNRLTLRRQCLKRAKFFFAISPVLLDLVLDSRAKAYLNDAYANAGYIGRCIHHGDWDGTGTGSILKGNFASIDEDTFTVGRIMGS